jgi:hypothetical protein
MPSQLMHGRAPPQCFRPSAQLLEHQLVAPLQPPLQPPVHLVAPLQPHVHLVAPLQPPLQPPVEDASLLHASLVHVPRPRHLSS